MAEGGMIHTLKRVQIIPARRGEVWRYFCDPGNLNALTPPDMNFEIVRGGDTVMYEGELIEYRVEFLRGVRSLWLTEISHVRECEYFVDEQRLGPYRFWYHEHIFEEISSGTRMVDHVSYAVPFGLVGDLLNGFWIAPRLNRIFDFRRRAILELFGDGK
jgi:ligand-binding SRPBCC domain-containing protein